MVFATMIKKFGSESERYLKLLCNYKGWLFLKKRLNRQARLKFCSSKYCLLSGNFFFLSFFFIFLPRNTMNQS